MLRPLSGSYQYQTAADASTHAVPFKRLSEKELNDWEAIRDANAAYRSPFFAPQFVAAVDNLIPNVEVAVQSQAGRTTAILPFQRMGACRARPVGAGINDAHGVIAAPNYECDVLEFLRSCNLSSFFFHASPLNIPGVPNFEYGRVQSFLADLCPTEGSYEDELRKRHATIARQGQKTRRLIREFGPMRFEFDCRDPKLINRLLELKSAQYRRTHTFDLLSVSWIRNLLFRLHAIPEPELRGLVSVLYFGEMPVALHYGILDGDLLHYWFPVFDPKYRLGSPGTQLFLEVSRQAAQRGVRAIDMGYGEQPYKRKLTNVVTEVSQGLINGSSVTRALHKQYATWGPKLKNLKFRETLKPIARRIMPTFGKRMYT